MLNKQLMHQKNLPWHDSLSLLSLPENFQASHHFSIQQLYPTYPIYTFAIDGIQVILEGLVYNATHTEIERTITPFFAGQLIGTNALQIATAHWTGEWCLWVQKGADLYIINDPLGRLPMYWFQSENHFFIGRHLGLLASNHLLQPDAMSIASQLWSSYLLGNGTLYKDVRRLPGGSLMHLHLATGQATLTNGTPYNFDGRNNQPLQQQAEQLAGLFKQACGRIASSWSDTINISQSGGQDSRAVAVGFREAVTDNRLIASSFIMHGAEKDALLGKTIADALHIPFTSYTVQGNAVFEQELLANKMGMNYVAMAFIHDFYKQMLQHHNSFLYVTGDGGDKALPYLGEKNPRLSLDQLVMQLSQRHAATPIAQVAALLHIKPDDILHLIHTTVAAYPEQNNNNKSIHFAIYERAAQSFFEGEDRSRYFAWATTPFYDLDFFIAAMQVPDAYKKHYTIYKPFQNILSKTIADIPDASGHSINNWKFTARKTMLELFRSAPPTVKNIVRTLGGVAISVNQATPNERQQLVHRLSNSASLQSVLNPEAVASFLQVANQEQYQYMRTLILLDQFLK